LSELNLAGRGAASAHYQVAGVSISSNCTWPATAGLVVSGAPAHDPIDLRSVIGRYAGGGWIAGRHPRFAPLGDGAIGYAIDGVAELTIDATRIGCRLNTELPADLWPDVLLGPPLLFALAARGIWALHASAVVRNSRAVALLGRSGTGKSTAARVLAERLGLARLADDVMPFSVAANGAHVFGSFPQLKVGGDTPWHTDRAQLVAVIDLNGDRETLDAPQRALKLAANTMAARLFSFATLAEHLRDLSAIAERIEMQTLNYRHDDASLNRLAVMLERWL
jgi:hypothetical protein